MPSIQSQLLIALLRITRRKRIYSSVQSVLEGIRKVRKQGPARPSNNMLRSLEVQHQTLDGIELYQLSPRTPQAAARHLLYLHGGAYIRPITSHHWRFLQRLVEQTGCTITVPLYPLAPEASCKQAVDAVVRVYKHLCTTTDTGSLTLAGDSAGGGLSLALCYALREKGLPLPAQLVLICPWLDVSMQHPAITTSEKHDPMLAAIGLKEAGRLYAGDLSVEHSHVSPIHGNLQSLPPTLLFAGTRDIAHYDALLFADKMRAAGVPVDLQIGEGMIHVWPILPIPEGKKALELIVSCLPSAG